MSQYKDNPYEAIVNGSTSSRPLDKPTKRPAGQSSVLAKATRRRQIAKPRARLGVRYRYQFEMPPPTMDPKMLLGDLCPKSYATPFLTPMELDARPIGAPGDPNFGMHVNLVDPSSCSKSPPLTFADEALLVAIETDRPNNPASAGQRKKGMPARPLRRDSNPAPFLRRMSYDEYFAKGSTLARPQNVNVNTSGSSALTKLARPTRTPDSQVRASSRSSQLVQRSFLCGNRPLRHPDHRKASVTPVSMIPVFPDLSNLGADFIAVEFGKNAIITHDERMGDDNMLEKSAKLMTTISVADDEKKMFLACFTPTDSTLEEIEKKTKNEEAADGESGKTKSLLYDWVHEYSIREGSRGKSDAVPQRACFALTEHEGPNNERVATLGRIGTNWKLSRRLGTLPRLGKSHLRLNVTDLSKETREESLKKNVAVIEKSS